MFKNYNNDNDTEDGYTHSGRIFKEVHIENMLKKKYGEEGFYSGEAELRDEKHSKTAWEEEGKAEELRRREPETSENVHNIEVSTIIPPIDSVVLRNQSNPNHQSIQRTVNSSPPHI
jgi:hypothetical protein